MDDFINDKNDFFRTTSRIKQQRIASSGVKSASVAYGGIGTNNVSETVRQKTAIVAPPDKLSYGDFTDIQAAIDKVSSLGGGTVFIKNGTYIVNGNIEVPSSISLVGETADGAIIDFNNQAYQIGVKGTLIYNTGTVAVNNKSTSVTGTGTTWTVAMIGDSILLNGAFYTIGAVASTTSITLTDAFSGDNITGATYYICVPLGNVSMSSLTVQNSTATTGAIYCLYAVGTFFDGITCLTSTLGLNFVNSDGGTFNGVIMDGCGSGWAFNNSANSSIDTIVINNSSTGDGLSCTAVNAFSLFNFGIFNSAGRGLYVASSFNFGIIDFAILSNTGIAIEVTSSNDGNILSGSLFNNTTDGIKLTANVDRLQVTNNILRNNGGWGINIANANCDDNLILGNTLRLNTSGSVTNSGTTTLIRSNIGQADN